MPATHDSSPSWSVRLWPGVLLVCLLLAGRFGLKLMVPGFDGFLKGMLTTFGASAVLLLWWLFFSRIRWSERAEALGVAAAGLLLTWLLKDESMGPLWFFGYALPFFWLGFILWALVVRGWTRPRRRRALVVTVLVVCGGWTAVRTEGITGDHVAEFAWRWSETAEARLLSDRGENRSDAQPAGHLDGPADWPGFRGPRRDGLVHGTNLITDWDTDPPHELWRRAVGPGWSSFAVRGGLLYTQEQRGEHEVVAAYEIDSGRPVWIHRDEVRFFESNAGAGPRGTPTLAGETVVSLGATGILNALDAGDGSLRWTRNAATDTEASLPTWGVSGSPLVFGDLVVVAASGSLIAYDLATGERRWQGPAGAESYSSPHLVQLGDVPQVVQLRGEGAIAVDATTGGLLWQHDWSGFPIVQPAQIGSHDLLLSVDGDSGVRRIELRQQGGEWTVEERWTSRGLKPYFNDFVEHQGHLYGFDGRILACLDAASGERRWKGGRYGNGQLLLLAEQDLLLVISDRGDLALVRADPDGFVELAHQPALQGKTWNHPVLVDDLLLVRNGEEMAAFRLPTESRDRP